MFSVISDEGQRNELESFYRENLDRLLNLALSHLHNDIDAEDAVQKAFCDIADKPDNFFEIPEVFRINYICAVVRNISIEMYNKQNKVRLEPLDEDKSYDDNLFSFEENLIGKISKDELKRFIKTLPPLRRDVLTLRCLMGFSTAETADKLNISESAVKKRLRLAREAVLNFIRKNEGETV